MQIKVDGYTRTCLTVLCVLLAVLIVGLWSEMPMAPALKAAEDVTFGNSAAQRKAVETAQDQIIGKMDELIKLLKSGDVKVQIEAKAGGSDASVNKTK
jgi:hypothetical protein